MTDRLDAVLILFDRAEHPTTLADTALALRSLKGVWHTELLSADAVVEVATVRRMTEAALSLLSQQRRDRDADRAEAADERLRQVGAL